MYIIHSLEVVYIGHEEAEAFATGIHSLHPGLRYDLEVSSVAKAGEGGSPHCYGETVSIPVVHIHLGLAYLAIGYRPRQGATVKA